MTAAEPRDPSDRFANLPRAAQACLVALCLAAALGLALALRTQHVEGDITLAVLLIVLCAAGGVFEVIAPGDYALQPNYAFFFWGAVALPPGWLVLLAVACFAPMTLMGGTAVYKMVFNIANYVLAGLAAFGLASMSGLAVGVPDAGAGLMAALLGAAIGAAAVNHALLVLMIATATGTPLRDLAGLPLEGAPRSLGVGLMGACLAILWALSPALVVLAAGPVAMITHSLWVPMLRHRAQTDSKTGLHNFGHFTKVLNELVDGGTPFTITMIDLDHLRVINNTAGHLAGDRAIRGIADELAAITPPSGVAARFGGEEFCVLLPGASMKETLEFTAHLRDRLLRIDFRETDSHDELRVRFSAGIAEFPRHARTAENLVAAADAATYLAKERGRDRTCTADEVAEAGDRAPSEPRQVA